MTSFEYILAWRYLRPLRREKFVSAISLFSMLGIMLGVATLIVVTSLMNGIRAEMSTLFIGVDGPVNMLTQPLAPKAAREAARALEGKRHITYALAKISGQVMATYKTATSGVQVLALGDDGFAHKPLFAGKLPEQFDGLFLGESLARALGVREGDSMKLIAPQGNHTVAGFVPRIKSFRVAGTFKLGMHHYDSSLIVMPFEQALRFFKPPRSSGPVVRQFELGVAQPDDAARIAAALHAESQPSAMVYDWQSSNSSLFAALAIQRNVMLVILALIVLVAAFNIISSLIMLVQDKRTDIAILRTMGASRGQLMRAFCLSGTLIGLIGTALGVVLGLLAAANLEGIKRGIEALTGQEILVEEIYFLSSLPVRTDSAEVMVIAFFSVALSLLSTLYPARRAAQVEPAEALRYG